MGKYFTKEGLEELKKELKYLENEKRKEIAVRIKEAASFGDLKENAAYTEAKEEQAFLQGKIVELKNKLKEATVIKKENTGKVEPGSTVVLLVDDSEEVTYTLVDEAEADIFRNKISISSPLGELLLKKKKGDKVELNLNSNITKYLIKEIK